MVVEGRRPYSTLAIHGNDSVVINLGEPVEMRDEEEKNPITINRLSNQLNGIRDDLFRIEETLSTLGARVDKLEHFSPVEEKDNYPTEEDPEFYGGSLPEEESQKDVYPEELFDHTQYTGNNGGSTSGCFLLKVLSLPWENGMEVAEVDGRYFSFEEFSKFILDAHEMQQKWMKYKATKSASDILKELSK